MKSNKRIMEDGWQDSSSMALDKVEDEVRKVAAETGIDEKEVLDYFIETLRDRWEFE